MDKYAEFIEGCQQELDILNMGDTDHAKGMFSGAASMMERWRAWLSGLWSSPQDHLPADGELVMLRIAANDPPKPAAFIPGKGFAIMGEQHMPLPVESVSAWRPWLKELD